MQVQKRDGTLEPVSFDKVLSRVRKSARGLQVNPDALAQQVLSRIYDKVPTTQLDELTAANAASLARFTLTGMSWRRELPSVTTKRIRHLPLLR